MDESAHVNAHMAAAHAAMSGRLRRKEALERLIDTERELRALRPAGEPIEPQTGEAQ